MSLKGAVREAHPTARGSISANAASFVRSFMGMPLCTTPRRENGKASRREFADGPRNSRKNLEYPGACCVQGRLRRGHAPRAPVHVPLVDEGVDPRGVRRDVEQAELG